MNNQSPRHLPQWTWVLGWLFFPTGLFVVYGSARLLSWRRATLFAALSYGCIIGFAWLMMRLEHGGATVLVRSVAALGGVAMLCGWDFSLHRIGRRAAYWSPAVQRGWRRAAWFAAALLCLGCVNVALAFVLSRLHIL